MEIGMTVHGDFPKSAKKSGGEILNSRMVSAIVHEELDPIKEVFLLDHAMNGIPILPGVIGIDGFRKAAIHFAQNMSFPDGEYSAAVMENIRFLVPMKFYRNQKKTITWKVHGIAKGDNVIVSVSLESDLLFMNRPPKHVVHFTGVVHLTSGNVRRPEASSPVKWLRKKSVDSKTIYNLFFHGPSFQVLDSVQRNGDTIIGRASKNLKPIVLNGVEQSMPPLLIELCFQTVGVHQAGNTGVLALPSSIHTLTIYDYCPKNLNDFFAEVRYSNPDDVDAGYDARVLDQNGNVILEIGGYVTSPLPFPVDPALIEPMRLLADELKENAA